MRSSHISATRSYREPTVITAQILNAVRAGANKTAIMYRARLSFEQLQRYLRRLNELGLLGYNKETRIYTATQKGLLYLGNFTEMQGIAEELQLKRATIMRLLSFDENGSHDNKDSVSNLDARTFLVSSLGKIELKVR